MDLFEIFSSCLQQFRSHPLRTFLTLLGIVIGEAALLTMVGIGKGTVERVVQDMERLGGAGLIILQSPEKRHGDSAAEFSRLVLNAHDLRAIPLASNHVDQATPVIVKDQPFSHKDKLFDSQCFGVRPDYRQVRGWELERGRFILPSDLERRKKVCILGSTAREMLFAEGTDPLGKVIRIRAENFTVVGLMSRREFEAGRWMNQVVLIPISTMKTRFHRREHFSRILVRVRDTSKVPMVTRQIERSLESRHPQAERFDIISQAEVIRSVNQSTLLLRLSQIVSATIVLMVGGIGIMNLMLVSVTERTREIGLRKAVGATDMDIMWQFLAEAVTVSMVGGIIGVGVGIALGDAASGFIARYLHDNIPSIVTLKDVAFAAGFILFMGVVFGLYPALRAARLDPSKALGYE